MYLVLNEAWPSEPGVPWVVAETDGGMVPIVTPDPAQPDQRRGKSVAWKEAKLCLAHALGRATLCDGGTLQGGVEGAGDALPPSSFQAYLLSLAPPRAPVAAERATIADWGDGGFGFPAP